MNDLRWFADNAGKRRDPYPHEAAQPFDVPRCALPDCGAPLTGDRGNDGWRRQYCGDSCRTRHTSLLQFAASEAGRHERRLALRAYE